MNAKTLKVPGTSQNNTVLNPTLPQKVNPGFIQPNYSRTLYFTVTSNVYESFVVDWQLNDK